MSSLGDGSIAPGVTLSAAILAVDLHRNWGYPPGVDSADRDEIRAAIGAHQQLGGDYEQGVAESLVERIGTEIDRRVDARLGQTRTPVSPHHPVWPSLTLGLGSLFAGLGASGIVLNGGAAINSSGIVTHAPSSGQVGLDAVIWVVIGAVNVAFARRR